MLAVRCQRFGRSSGVKCNNRRPWSQIVRGRLGSTPVMLRFTIRELVLLTLVVAMGVGWWLEHKSHALLAEKARSLEDVNAELERESIAKEEALRNLLDEELRSGR